VCLSSYEPARFGCRSPSGRKTAVQPSKCYVLKTHHKGGWLFFIQRYADLEKPEELPPRHAHAGKR
jgi:hypothetical protein